MIRAVRVMAGIVIMCTMAGITSGIMGDAWADYTVKTVAENLRVPWAIDFAPDGRIFFTERHGDLRVIQDGILVPEPVATIRVSGTEGGLLGVALAPDFGSSDHIYLYYTYADPPHTYNRIVRYTEAGGALYNMTVIIDGIPGGPWHDGGRIRFGPDGMLYATTGDAGRPHLAQDTGSAAGKILRMEPDGGIPADNPFGSVVFSYGHRNPQGIDWSPDGSMMIAAEHGPSGERGAAHDEVNIIRAGANYGWPEIIGGGEAGGMEVPAIHTGEETWAPSGASFYDSGAIPEWHGKLFVATLRGGHLRMLDMANTGDAGQALLLGEFGRLRDVAAGPDGHMYVLTGNRDGRGEPAINDDRILRLVPAAGVPSPLEQARLGVPPGDVACGEGLVAMISPGGSAACAGTEHVQALTGAGWMQSRSWPGIG